MKWRKRNCLLSPIVLCFSFSSCHSQNTDENNSLQLVETIALPGVSGRIDHLTFDSKNKILFVVALGNNTVEVIDLKSNKAIHTVKNLREPQGLAFFPGSNSLVVANGKNGECDIFNATGFQKMSSIKLEDDADNVRYDAVNNKIYVGYASGGIAVIDAITFKLFSQIKLSAHPESFQINRSANRMYVNVPDAHLLEVIDLDKNDVIAKWEITEAKANFPMALDEADHRLFIGCRRPSKLLVLDMETGKIISSVDIDGDTDDIFYNAVKREIYVSCGSGDVDVITQSDANNYKSNGRIQTRSGARTSLFMPEFSMLIVAAPATLTNHAQLMIYKTNEKPN